MPMTITAALIIKIIGMIVTPQVGIIGMIIQEMTIIQDQIKT